jgi:hypothetical protein
VCAFVNEYLSFYVCVYVCMYVDDYTQNEFQKKCYQYQNAFLLCPQLLCRFSRQMEIESICNLHCSGRQGLDSLHEYSDCNKTPAPFNISSILVITSINDFIVLFFSAKL